MNKEKKTERIRDMFDSTDGTAGKECFRFTCLVRAIILINLNDRGGGVSVSSVVDIPFFVSSFVSILALPLTYIHHNRLRRRMYTATYHGPWACTYESS